MDTMNTVGSICQRDIIPILQNALDYGKPWDTLYQACIEEILDLRNQVVNLGGSFSVKMTDGGPAYPVLHI